ncbi:MAG: dUTP diphosphatase [Clostridiaceae bacterium]|nr:dUTP diphosphatase [Clostridiaceae bacterium]
MNITDLFELQKKVNNNINIDPSLTAYKVVARKNLELHVKMSDLANETQCYKYWIDDEPILDHDAIFDKYITCLNQIISLGLNNNYSDIGEIIVEESEYCLSDQFLNLYIDINDQIISPSKDHYSTLVEDFLTLAISLGFSDEMILDGFKNICKEEIAL